MQLNILFSDNRECFIDDVVTVVEEPDSGVLIIEILSASGVNTYRVAHGNWVVCRNLDADRSFWPSRSVRPNKYEVQ